MTYSDPKEFAQAVVEEMVAHHHTLWIDPEQHVEQHEFIAEMIAERRERAARRQRIEERIAGSLVLSAIVGLITLLGSGVLNWFHRG